MCASERSELNDLKAEYQKNTIDNKWSDTTRIEIKKLTDLNNEFADAEAKVVSDTYRGGTIASSMYVQAADKLSNGDFTAALEKLANDEFELVSESEFKKTDEELNSMYKKMMKVKQDDEGKKLLRESQRIWIKLRDQWGIVYTTHYPGKKANAARLGKYEATKNRIRSLNDQLSY
jgi:uncharacterized protein YecT (DUF1311 family)